jgi:N-carbamoylputrescine amidase
VKVTFCEMSDDRDGFTDDWKRLCRHVRRESSDLVLLPEMPFYHWFCAEPKLDPKVWNEAVSEHTRWARRLGELGSPNVLGTRPVNKGGKRFNEGYVWTRKDGVEGVQLKNYVPDEPGFYESRWYQRGDRSFSPFEAGGLEGGFMICSDMWAIASARALGKDGVHLLAVPRTTGKASVEKWLAGGRAAAVVSGAFCVSSNRAGKRGEVEFGGTGWAVDPDGQVLGLTSKEKPFVTVTVDPKRAEKAKKTYPRNALEPD